MILICWFRTERGKAWSGTALWVWGEGEHPKRLNREGLSTDTGCAGGPVRSSGEAPAGRGGGGAKGPGHLWLCSFGQLGVCVWEELVRTSRSRRATLLGDEDDKSPVTGDCHAGICGSRGVRFPPATRLVAAGGLVVAEYFSGGVLRKFTKFGTAERGQLFDRNTLHKYR